MLCYGSASTLSPPDVGVWPTTSLQCDFTRGVCSLRHLILVFGLLLGCGAVSIEVSTAALRIGVESTARQRYAFTRGVGVLQLWTWPWHNLQLSGPPSSVSVAHCSLPQTLVFGVRHSCSVVYGAGAVCLHATCLKLAAYARCPWLAASVLPHSSGAPSRWVSTAALDSSV